MKRWDAATEKNKVFTVKDCMRLALQHWSRVREIEMTMSGPNEKKTDTTEGSDGQEPKKKKRREKEERIMGPTLRYLPMQW